MNVKNCRRCGRIFNYLGGQPICPSCREEIEKKFDTVKNYIRDNPKVGIPAVCEACEVDSNQIQQWIREERLQLTAESPIGVPGENCGTLIHSGKSIICRIVAKNPLVNTGFNAGGIVEVNGSIDSRVVDGGG